MSTSPSSNNSPIDMVPVCEGKPKNDSSASEKSVRNNPQASAEGETPQDREDNDESVTSQDSRDTVCTTFKLDCSTRTWANFREIAEEKFEKAALNNNSCNEFIEYIKTVPFIKETFENEIHFLEENFEQPNANMNTNDLLSLFKRAGERHNVLHKIVMYLSRTEKNIALVEKDLLTLSNLSQAEEGASYSRKRDNNGDVKECTPTPTDLRENLKEHLKYIQFAEPGKMFCELMQKKENLERFRKDGRKIGCLDELNPPERELVQNFSEALQSAFKAATFCEKNCKKDTFSASLRSLKRQLGSFGNADVGNDNDVVLPGPKAPEVEYVQPLLFTILVSLAAKIDSASLESTVSEGTGKDSAKPKPRTPHKIIKLNPALASTEARQKRIADNAVAAEGNFKYLHLDGFIEVTVEIKPGEREKAGPESLLKEGVNQVLSHLSKHLYVGFNFVGIGSDTVATGMYLTVTHVQFIRLKLEKMGTPDVKLVLCKSSILPILSQENFEKYIEAEDKKYQQQWENLKSMMYGTGKQPQEGDSCTTTSVPSGVVALFNILTTSRADLFGPSGYESKDIDVLLGTGSFASVYSNPGSANNVVKLSRYGASKEINDEAEVLRELEMENRSDNIHIGSDDHCIVRLVRSALIEITIGGVSKKLSGLYLAPRGQPASRFLAPFESKKRKELLVYFGQRLLKTLEWMNEIKKLHHRDVSERNLMVDPETSEPFLIDFGLSCRTEKMAIGFVGSPRFAHRDIFTKYPKERYFSKKEYDKSALAFSMATLSAEGYCPWESFQPLTLNTKRMPQFQAWANERSNTAWRLLEESGFHKSWKDLCFDNEYY